MYNDSTAVMRSVVQKVHDNEYQSILNDMSIAGVGKITICGSVKRRICERPPLAMVSTSLVWQTVSGFIVDSLTG
jgi:hypothetical protein